MDILSVIEILLPFLNWAWIIISIILALWVYKDTQERGESSAWMLAPLLVGLIGLVIYLIFRKQKTFEKWKGAKKKRRLSTK